VRKVTAKSENSSCPFNHLNVVVISSILKAREDNWFKKEEDGRLQKMNTFSKEGVEKKK